MTMKFQFFVRNVYGTPKMYPANEIAHKFAALLNVKTFNTQQLAQIIDITGQPAEQVIDPASKVSL
jgi:hypothetical protein